LPRSGGGGGQLLLRPLPEAEGGWLREEEPVQSPSRRRAATRRSRRAGPVGPPAGREGRRRPRQGGGGLYIHIHSVLILCQRQWYASRAGHREVWRSGVTALGGPSGSRASVGMAGGECRQRARARYHHSAERSSRRPSPRGAGGRVVQWIWGGWGAPRVLRLGRPGGAFLARARVRYHYPAERSSRRPSPRGAGGRAVRLQPLMHQWARCAGGLGRSSWAGHASRLDPAARGDGWVRAPSRGPGAARQGRAALGAERRWRGQSESRTGRRGRAGPPCHHA